MFRFGQNVKYRANYVNVSHMHSTALIGAKSTGKTVYILLGYEENKVHIIFRRNNKS